MNIDYSNSLNINTDKSMLKKALSNIISNAVNYTDNGKNINIYFEKTAIHRHDQDKGKHGNEQAAQNRHEPQRDGREKAHVSDGRADLAGQCAHISRHTAHLPGHRAYNAATKCRKYRKAASGRRSS